MARTLTEQEQHTLQRFRDRLLHALSSDEKGYAAGIASALVRFRGTEITEADLDRILDKYDAPKDSLLGAIKNQLLKPVNGKDDTYTLRTKDEKALPAAEKEAGEKQADKSKKSDGKRTTGERKPRRRSRKKATEAEDENADQADATGNDETQISERRPARKRSAKRAGQTKTAVHAGKDSADSDDVSQSGEVADNPVESAAATETSVVDIAPGRSMRRAAQARNEADEAALSTEEEATAPESAASDAAKADSTDVSPDVAEPVDEAEASGDDTSDDGSADALADAGVSNDAPDKGPVDSQPSPSPDSTDADESAAPAEADQKADGGAEDSTDSSGTEAEDDSDSESEVPADDSTESSKDKRAHNHKRKKHERDPRRIPYVRRGDEDDAAIRQKIIGLDQRFWMNGWLLSHPGAYVMFEHELNAMSDALADGDVLPGDITRRQLAYQMGGDEKFFEYGSDGFRLLRAMGLESIIRHRPLPKIDLVYHAPRRRKRMRVLVTENLDPYLDVHDLMYEEGRSLFLGERIHAVVLGGGTPILEHNRLSLLLDTLGADHIDVLYWGDIDRAGLELMCKLKEILGDKYGFEPFTPAYRLMIQKAMERFPDAADNEITGQENVDIYDLDFLCQGLTDEEAAYARAVIENCCLIPQEILTKRDL